MDDQTAQPTKTATKTSALFKNVFSSGSKKKRQDELDEAMTSSSPQLIGNAAASSSTTSTTSTTTTTKGFSGLFRRRHSNSNAPPLPNTTAPLATDDSTVVSMGGGSGAGRTSTGSGSGQPSTAASQQQPSLGTSEKRQSRTDATMTLAGRPPADERDSSAETLRNDEESVGDGLADDNDDDDNVAAVSQQVDLVDDSDMADIINKDYIVDQMQQQTQKKRPSASHSISGTTHIEKHRLRNYDDQDEDGDESNAPNPFEKLVDPLTNTAKHDTLEFDISKLPLPKPFHNDVGFQSTKAMKRKNPAWAAPTEWSVIPSKVDGPQSCIRVFRREGTFVTVSCSLSMTAKDLCQTLAKKFFIAADVSSTYRLYLVRNEDEMLVHPDDQPLLWQQTFMAEVGYDLVHDKVLDILREDNSYLFRWVYAPQDGFTFNYDNATSRKTLAPPVTAMEKHIDAIIKMTQQDQLLSPVLDLAGLNLATLPLIVQKNTRQIAHLDLSKNVMLDLSPILTLPFSSLSVLKLTRIQIGAVPKQITRLTSLEILDLSHNHIRTLRDSDLNNLTNLRTLILSNNRISGKTCLPYTVVSPLVKLERLDLSCNWIKGDLPRGVLMVGNRNWSGTMLLDKPITETGGMSASAVVEGGMFNPLVELDLSHNLISQLPNDFGYHLIHLRTLSLASNVLAKVPESLVRGLPKIELVDVRGNLLRGNLVFLGMNGSGNGGTASGMSSNSESPKAREDEQIEFAEQSVDQKGTVDQRDKKIVKILLDNNEISDLQISNPMPHLQTIVSIRNSSLLQLSFTSHLPNLTTLVLSHSKLAFLPDDVFQHTPLLEVLILNGNQLTGLPPSITLLSSLIRLEVASNSIVRLPSGIREWKSLEILDLHSNNLKEVPAEIWELKVKFLNLSSNVLESWPDIPATGHPTSGAGGGGGADEKSTRQFSIYRQSLMHSTTSGGDSGHGSDPRALTKERESMFTQSLINLTEVASLATSLQWLSVADNRLDSAIFESAIVILSSLRSLNVSHNEAMVVPNGALKASSATLEELFLSGNHLTQVPEDIFTFKKLNGNRLNTLPPELAQVTNLRVLDVGRNQLRYNVGNWPHDWNWTRNRELRYLNLSGNPKLEIRNTPNNTVQQQPIVALSGKKDKGRMVDQAAQDLSSDRAELFRFDALSKIRVLSVMDVNLAVSVPEENPTRRVRVNATGGASAQWKKYVGLDSTDPSTTSTSTTPVQQVEQLNVQPTVSYGVADNLGEKERSNSWDIVLWGAKFWQTARDDALPADKTDKKASLLQHSGSATHLRGGQAGDCLFGLFDGGLEIGNWVCKWLNDNMVIKFDNELKKVFKERQAKRVKIASRKASGDSKLKSANPQQPHPDEAFANASDEVLIQHALRRTFLVMNKQLGGMWYAAETNTEGKGDMMAGGPDDMARRARRQSSGLNARTSRTSSGTVSSAAVEDDVSSPLMHKRNSSKDARDSGKRKLSLLAEAGMELSLKRSTIKNIVSVPEENEVPESAAMAEARRNFESASARENEGFGYWRDLDDDEKSDEDMEDDYLRLGNAGPSGIIAYLSINKLFIANCGDCMAILSRSGTAIPVSMKHTLNSFQGTLASSSRHDDLVGQDKNKRDDSKIEMRLSSLAKRELHRIRQTGGQITADGLISGQCRFTRSFGYFSLLPHVNAQPQINYMELQEKDEFLIIASAMFWNIVPYQTAVDVARMKANDALEAAMVLRDFALAYSNEASYTLDEDTESPYEKERLRRKNVDLDGPLRYRKRDPFTVMVINLADFMGGPSGKARKVFSKVKKRREDAVDSAIARLAPEVEPPTGQIAMVFTDVRNSTTLWEKMPVAMRVAIREHNTLMRRNMRQHGGYEVKTEGDAFVVAFKSCTDAIRWCLACQVNLLEIDWPQDILESPDGKIVRGAAVLEGDENDKSALLYRGLSIRMGINCGSPVCELDPITRRMDYLGHDVNKTARVCSAAEGGQILISKEVEEQFRKEKAKARGNQAAFPSNLEPTIISIGEKKLKGIENPEKLYLVLPQALLGRFKVPPPPAMGQEAVPVPPQPKEPEPMQAPFQAPQQTLPTDESIFITDQSAITIKSFKSEPIDFGRHNKKNSFDSNAMREEDRILLPGNRSRRPSMTPADKVSQPSSNQTTSNDTVARQQYYAQKYVESIVQNLEKAVLRLLENRLSLVSPEILADIEDSAALSVIPLLDEELCDPGDALAYSVKETITMADVTPEMMKKFVKRLERAASTLAVAMTDQTLANVVATDGVVDVLRLLLNLAKTGLASDA